MFVKTSLREAMHQVRVSYKLVCQVPIVLSAIFFLTELITDSVVGTIS